MKKIFQSRLWVACLLCCSMLPVQAQETYGRSNAAEALVARAFIEQWKVNRALYRQYGGRVIFQQGGAEPLDAWQQFLRGAQQTGQFRLINKEIEPTLWSYYTTNSIHRFYPEATAEKEQAINTPWWLMDAPAD
jgi:hypothetical protein